MFNDFMMNSVIGMMKAFGMTPEVIHGYVQEHFALQRSYDTRLKRIEEKLGIAPADPVASILPPFTQGERNAYNGR